MSGLDRNWDERGPVFSVEETIDCQRVKIELTLGVDGSAHCVGLSVRAPEDLSHPGVTSVFLREIPIRKMIAAARERDLTPRAGDPFGIGESKPGRGRPLTDDHLMRVAMTYRSAVEGGYRPVWLVANAGGVPRPTAARWIAESRKRGILGPAISGPHGGESDG